MYKHGTYLGTSLNEKAKLCEKTNKKKIIKGDYPCRAKFMYEKYDTEIIRLPGSL